MDRTAATDLVIFGASGDLARRKIIPALQSLNGNGRRLRLLGAGRSDMSQEDFRAIVAEATSSQDLAAGAEWIKLDYSAPASYAELRRVVGEGKSVVFYLATPPQTFSGILDALSEAGLAGRDLPGEHRIVVEQPLGQDAPSARRLNEQLRDLFSEEQVFRIDHYLAKDTVQNVLAFRFSNSIFEPVWNRTMIQSIELTAAEEHGIENSAGYCARTGAVPAVSVHVYTPGLVMMNRYRLEPSGLHHLAVEQAGVDW